MAPSWILKICFEIGLYFGYKLSKSFFSAKFALK